MATLGVKELAYAILSCNPGDPDGVSSVKKALSAAVEACRSEGEVSTALQCLQLWHSPRPAKCRQQVHVCAYVSQSVACYGSERQSSALLACLAGPDAAEALLACLLQSFLEAGERGKVR